ncbi:MAG TPA: aldo/keto reductase [Ruminococcaceae bacterium]|nr:aldo/keto reductase [Oscillospiraceae bacterium]
MRYTTLGNTGLEVSAAVVGTWAIGGAGWGEVNEADSIRAIHAMLERGVNIIDTAPFYGCGAAEELVGRAVFKKRGDCLLVTKGGVLWDESGKPIKRCDRETIISGCEDSLRRLNTDYIDVFLIHWHDETTPMEEIARAVEDLRRAGKIRFAGASNFTEEMIGEYNKHGSFEVLQQPYSMVNREFEKLLKWAHGEGIGTMSYGSLGAGILTGGIRTLPNFAPGDMRSVFYDYFSEPKFSKIMALLKHLDNIAEKYSVPVAQVTVNWSAQSGFLDTLLMGVRNEAEADENCAAFEWELTGEDIAYINRSIESTLS